MAKLLRKQFNIPCSGDGTFILLVLVKSGTSTDRYICGVARQRDGVLIKYLSAGIYDDLHITVDNGIANVKLYMGDDPVGSEYYRCCFIPNEPFSLPSVPDLQ